MFEADYQRWGNWALTQNPLFRRPVRPTGAMKLVCTENYILQYW